MNVGYLRHTILDQIDRAQSLADEIPRRPGHAALGRLAASCRAMLEDEVRLLEEALSALGSGDASRAAEALAAIKRGASKIGAVEAYGMPPLHCQSEQAVFLNDVLTAIHSRIGLPFPSPAVSCTSSEYYFSHLLTNTVYVPLSEAAFLLHMPDFYHELGHLLLVHPTRDTKSRLALAGAADAFGVIDKWYRRQVGGTGRSSLPVPLRDGVKWMWSQWKSSWIQEAFCDLFALFAAGPAYAYSNLHLVLKTDDDIYALCLFTDQEHPASEARMRLLDAGMRLLGHGREALEVRNEWDAMAQLCGSPPPEYNHAFPSQLLQEIAGAIIPALGRSGLRGYSGAGGMQDGGENTVASILNDAWRSFLDREDDGYRSLEKDLAAKLAAMSCRSAA